MVSQGTPTTSGGTPSFSVVLRQPADVKAIMIATTEARERRLPVCVIG
jgi:hypothetical protein